MENNIIKRREYVYILSNTSFNDNIFKIGWSRNNPVIRANNLYTSGVPTPFIIEFVISTYNGNKLETVIHNYLKQYRINEKREFFKLTKEQIYTMINDLKLELINVNLDIQNEISNKKINNTDMLKSKNNKNYNCEICNYTTKNLFDYNKHCNTIKHINSSNLNNSDNLCIKNDNRITIKNFECKNCNKIYKDNSGLWKHKKKCIKYNNLNNECNSQNINAQLLIEITEQNKKLSNLLIEKNQKILELSTSKN